MSHAGSGRSGMKLRLVHRLGVPRHVGTQVAVGYIDPDVRVVPVGRLLQYREQRGVGEPGPQVLPQHLVHGAIQPGGDLQREERADLHRRRWCVAEHHEMVVRPQPSHTGRIGRWLGSALTGGRGRHQPAALSPSSCLMNGMIYSSSAGAAGMWGNSSSKAPMVMRRRSSVERSPKSSCSVFWV